MNPHQDIRIGLGTDSHRIEAGGPMILGGISIDYPAHFVGHSDADVLLHAITDAVLGAAGLPDIGELFPNDREENRGRDSGEMLALAVQAFRKAGWELSQIDCVIELERPKISPLKETMRRRISEILQISEERIRLKGKTGEGIGDVGTGQLGKAICIALACRNLALDDK
ncbi:2-C-methyl-D-erythritol 2,4-cyclodiphosphate synthase [Pirellulaceae bacterium SH501]